MKFFTRELTAALWKDFESYFEFNGQCSGCWCMNHRVPLGLDFEGEAAKLAMRQLVETGRVHGVLAYVDDDPIPVGWCALDRRKTLPGHDCVGDEIACDSDIWALHCVTSRSDFKDQGVEDLLCDSAVQLAMKMGAKIVEAYPEPGSVSGQAFRTGNVFGGFESHFSKLNFAPVPRDIGDRAKFYRPTCKTLRESE